MNLFFLATVLTRLSPHWQWESSLRTKSPRPCSPLRTGAVLLSEFHHHGAPTFIHSFIHPPLLLRYIYYFSGLLSSTIKMNSSPLFLHQILIPSLPNFQAGGGQSLTQTSDCAVLWLEWSLSVVCLNLAGFFPFLKIYQSLQLIYTSAV